MIAKMPDHVDFYVRSMGKRLRVIAIATSDDEANAYMARHDEAAVVAEVKPFIFLARKWDQGEPEYR